LQRPQRMAGHRQLGTWVRLCAARGRCWCVSSGVDAGRPELKRCLEYLREGDTLLVSKIDRLARSTSDLYRIVSLLAEKGVSFKVIDDPSVDTSSRTGKLVMGMLALIAEFENDIRRERQMDGIAKAKERALGSGANHCLRPRPSKKFGHSESWHDRA
jgi:DNA invertase Pin-like site-specific DNA recombinase